MKHPRIRSILALLLMLTLLCTLFPAVALANAPAGNVFDSTWTEGSITVTKYKTETTVDSSSTAPATESASPTGTTTDAVTTGSGYEVLAGVTFKLYQVQDVDWVKKYYSYNDETAAPDVNSYVSSTEQDKWTIKDGVRFVAYEEHTTNADGVATWSNLPVGVYVLIETTAPENITTPLANPALIILPMVNASGVTSSTGSDANTAWLYDIHVYPKNHSSEGTVNIAKTDANGSPLSGVKFTVEKKDGDTWKPLKFSGTEWKEDTAAQEFTTDTDGKLTLSYLPAGLNGTTYRITEVSAPLGYIVNKTPLEFTVNTNNTITVGSSVPSSMTLTDPNDSDAAVAAAGTTKGSAMNAAIVNELPDITKLVMSNEETPSAKEWAQYAIGDTVPYQITITIPANYAELKTFSIEDTAAAADVLTWDKTSFKITYEGGTKTAIDASKITDITNGVKVDLLNNSVITAAIAAGKKQVTVTYNAVLGKSAVIAGTGNVNTGNVNTVALKYDQAIDPNATDPDDYTVTDQAVVYTYKYQFTKCGDTTTGTKLSGVQFELYADSACTTKIKLYDCGNGVYRPLVGTETESTNVCTYDDPDGTLTGTLTIQGLENGTYYLKETKTILGYNLLSAPVKFEVNVADENVIGTSYGWGVSSAVSGSTLTKETLNKTSTFIDTNHQTTIVNKSGWVLPKTGSMGYLLFCAAGLLLIGMGTVILLSGRKKTVR